jgi:hypothetical protein
MDNQILALLDRLDGALVPFAKEGEHLDLFLLGRAALVLLYNFPLLTRDIDVVWMRNSELEGKAIELSRKGSEIAEILGVYLDPVPQGLPPIPCGFQSRCKLLTGDWKVLKVWMLEVHDLAATKLKSFRPKDRDDLQNLCDRGLLTVEKLYARLNAAFPFRSQKVEDTEEDPDTPGWGKALANFKRVKAYLKGEITSI